MSECADDAADDDDGNDDWYAASDRQYVFDYDDDVVDDDEELHPHQRHTSHGTKTLSERATLTKMLSADAQRVNFEWVSVQHLNPEASSAGKRAQH